MIGGLGHDQFVLDRAGVLGTPGISVPAGVGGSGLPVGVELCAGAGEDDALLDVAAAVESVLPSCGVARVPGVDVDSTEEMFAR